MQPKAVAGGATLCGDLQAGRVVALDAVWDHGHGRKPVEAQACPDPAIFPSEPDSLLMALLIRRARP